MAPYAIKDTIWNNLSVDDASPFEDLAEVFAMDNGPARPTANRQTSQASTMVSVLDISKSESDNFVSAG